MHYINQLQETLQSSPIRMPKVVVNLIFDDCIMIPKNQVKLNYNKCIAEYESKVKRRLYYYTGYYTMYNGTPPDESQHIRVLNILLTTPSCFTKKKRRSVLV